MQNLFFSSSSNSKNPIFGQENVFLTQCVCFEGNMIIRDSIFYATFIVSSEFSTVHTCKYIGWVGWSLALACCQGRFWNISRLKDFLVALQDLLGSQKGNSDFALNGPCNAIYPEKMNSVSHKTWPFEKENIIFLNFAENSILIVCF